MKYYLWSHVFLVTGLISGYLLGGIAGLTTIAILIALEISLSFDNAVVNAKILEPMTQVWRDRFITYGLPLAIFGMRLVFPIVIVAVATGMSTIETFSIAVDEPERYHELLVANEMGIFAFGGSFLIMIFLGFFFDDDREDKWINILEDNVITKAVGSIQHIEIIIATAIGLTLTYYTDSTTVALAFFGGILLHEVIGSLDGLLSTNGVRNGLVGLLYLEVLDASFSFDGVIGAFAVTNNIFMIMIGLGIGAMYVRSMTLDFVDRGTLKEYRYLEHGAMYAIGALATIMMLKMFYHIPDMVTGIVGITFISIAFLHSKYFTKET